MAKSLPAAVFTCDNLPEEEESSFRGFIARMFKHGHRGGKNHRGGRNHRGGENKPEGRHGRHGGRHHKQQRGEDEQEGPRNHHKPRVESESNELPEGNMVVIAGVPFKRSFAKNLSIYKNGKINTDQDEDNNEEFGDDEEQRRHHGKHGGHGRNGHGRHHKKPHHSHCAGFLFWVGMIAVHFWGLKSLFKAQVTLEKLTGASPDGKSACAWRKGCGQKKVAQQPVQQVQQPIAVVSPSPITSAPVIEYSIYNSEEMDKDMGPTFDAND